MYAVIQSGGKQYRVSPGDLLRVEKLNGEVGDRITFENVLLVGGDDESRVGLPAVPGASVIGTIVDQTRGDKIVVFKFKRRKMYRRKTGHRQYLTAVRIEEIKTAKAPEKKARAKKAPDADSRKEAAPEKKARAKKAPDAEAGKSPSQESAGCGQPERGRAREESPSQESAGCGQPERDRA